MSGRVDGHVPLRYAEIQIFPSQNRYEVSICSEGDIESLEDGVLELLSPHLPAVKELCSKGCNATCKLSPPGNSNAMAWFTKSTLSRFLQIVRSSDVVHTTSSIKDEMLQLEEARKFHLSLYGQPKVEKASADTSKNELLRAMDLRLTALRTELTTAFCKAASAICSSKDIANLANFSDHFGGVDLRDGLHKLSQLNEERKGSDGEKITKHSVTGNSRNDVTKLGVDVQTLKPTPSDTHVKYGVSPAKAAQAERQNGSESDESSGPSDDDRGSAERSRTLIRSASPRRSASPMRRVQIGRGGSRRAAALTIKSIGYIPARDKSFPYKDGTGNSSDEEAQQPIKRTETHVRRMSVQDAINLFESKQKDHTEDNPQLRKSMSSLSVTASKSVLRRWSSGMGETSGQSEQEHEGDIADAPRDPESYDKQRYSGEDKSMLQTVPTSQETVEIPEDHVNSERYEKSDSDPIDIEEDTTASKEEDDTKKSAATTEWNRLKEAELNQMLMQMMESKPAKYTKTQQSRKQSLPSGQRGGFYDHYKEKRDEKLRGENTKKKAEKEAQFKAMQQILDERKAEMSSKNAKGVEKKPAVRKSQKPLKNSSPQPTKPIKESPKASLPKKASPRTSPLPPTRKSWPSTPPARAAAISPAKTPAANSSASTTPTRKKTQQTTSLPRIGPKVEKPQPPQRSVKEPLVESGKNSKTVKSALKKNGTTTKVKKVVTEECSDVVVPTKTGLYSKVARKSAVVPVEPKPFLRKGSRANPGVNPSVTKKNSSQPEEPQKSSENIAESREDDVVPGVTEEEAVTENHRELDSNPTAALDSEDPINIHGESSGTENSDSVPTEDHSDLVKKSIEDSPTEIQAEEESIISPSAWVEIEAVPPQQASAATGSTSPRVRHSLSQMLLEEINEPDIVEWGNAENPPAILYQKDAPKGLKRLLKFARKSKGDANNSGFSSPSVFSEGEDDSDGFMKKGALSSKNHESREPYSAQSGIGKFNARSNLQKLQESDLAAVPTAKGTRSFFSLSAFRGSAK